MPTAEKNLFKCSSTAAWSSEGKKVSGEWVPSRKVKKYAVVDGVASPILMDTEVLADGDTYTESRGSRYEGYTFGGSWYTDVNCTVEYDGAAVTSDVTLYGKFFDLEVDSHIFVVPSSTEDVNWNIYSYANSGAYARQFGSWPGTAITSDMKAPSQTENIVLEGKETIVYKVPFASNANDSLVILNNPSITDAQTDTKGFALTDANAIFWNGYANSTGAEDTNKGKVIELVLKIKDALSAAENQSVCNVGKAVAEQLVADYEKLPSGLDSYWAGAAIKTYDGADTSTLTYVPVSEVMAQLSAIATASTNPLNNIGTNVSTNPTAFIVAGVSVVGLVAVGGIFLLHKKKEN